MVQILTNNSDPTEGILTDFIQRNIIEANAIKYITRSINLDRFGKALRGVVQVVWNVLRDTPLYIKSISSESCTYLRLDITNTIFVFSVHFSIYIIKPNKAFRKAYKGKP